MAMKKRLKKDLIFGRKGNSHGILVLVLIGNLALIAVGIIWIVFVIIAYVKTLKGKSIDTWSPDGNYIVSFHVIKIF